MPRWEQIARGLRLDIHDGTYPPGASLPSEADIAHRYDCSRPTVRRAITTLVGEGLLTVAHGRGTFVRTDPDRYLIVIGADDHPDYLHHPPHGWLSLISSSPEDAHSHLRLGLAIDEATHTDATTFDIRPGRLLIHRRATSTPAPSPPTPTPTHSAPSNSATTTPTPSTKPSSTTPNTSAGTSPSPPPCPPPNSASNAPSMTTTTTPSNTPPSTHPPTTTKSPPPNTPPPPHLNPRASDVPLLTASTAHPSSYLYAAT
ncbi:GntR family transcriptional regulator [Frankia sp. CiP3]|uniref:GntR family transcriptional regulator n=1 Tax=Frankia sp. CiP3 TaxID=2880971 RepID=UPI0035ABA4FD